MLCHLILNNYLALNGGINLKDYKKIIILSSICLAVIIVIISILLGKNKNVTKQEEAISKNIEINQVEDEKLALNINKIINYSNQKVLDNIYSEQEYYIQNAYKVDISENITVYFAQGYLMNIYDDQEPIKNEKKFTIVTNNEYKVCNVEEYGYNYKEVFNYNENISSTTIQKSAEKDVEQYFIVRGIAVPTETLDEEVSDDDLALWYYEDYKNKKYFEDKNKEEYENEPTIEISGNLEDGFTYTDNENLNITIKPGNHPMEYEVTKK